MNRGEHDKPIRQSPIFLPDFCKPAIVLAVVLIAELTAMLIVLGRRSVHEQFWFDLAQTSLFLLWVGLGSAALLCLIRPRLVNVRARYTGIVSFAVMTGCAVLVAEAAYWLGQWWSGRTGAVSTLFPDAHLEFVLRTAGVAAIVSGLMLRYFYVSFEWKRNVESEARARVNALQARIRPHFLFNSMNIIASLTQRAPVRAETAIEDMADLFRLMLDDSKDLMPVHTEISVARKYIKLEKLRLEQRLNVEWKIGSIPRTAKTPVLMLQLLLENAVHFGVEQLADGGNIKVSVEMGDDDTLTIAVESPVADGTTTTGKGPDHAQQQDDSALDNIRLRLHELYADKAQLTVNRTATRFNVRVIHPAYGDSYEDISS